MYYTQTQKGKFISNFFFFNRCFTGGFPEARGVRWGGWGSGLGGGVGMGEGWDMTNRKARNISAWRTQTRDYRGLVTGDAVCKKNDLEI